MQCCILSTPVGANFDNGSAQWDGTKQGFANFGKRFLEALGGGPYKGQTSALSLRTFMVAIDGRPLVRQPRRDSDSGSPEEREVRHSAGREPAC